MPIYEYQCECCNQCFEKLVITGEDEDITCPNCCHTKAKRLMSAASCIGLSSDKSCTPGTSTGFS